MTRTKTLSKLQLSVLDGYRRHAGDVGITRDDLDKLLRAEDPEGLGRVEIRKCHHVSSQLMKLGLIEQCGVVWDGPSRVGVYRLAPGTNEVS